MIEYLSEALDAMAAEINKNSFPWFNGCQDRLFGNLLILNGVFIFKKLYHSLELRVFIFYIILC